MKNKKTYSVFSPLLLLLAVLFITKCSGKKETHIPNDIIPFDKMVQVMTDAHIIEALVMYGITNPADSTKSPEAYYHGLYLKHNITGEMYERSYQFYLSHPDLMEKIYTEVITELSKKQAEETRN